ncbi:MAG: M50 family metallopeptidase, partial [Armatimonadota bacterium]
ATTIIDKFAETSAARDAGLRVGDQIVAVNGQPVTKPFELTNAIRRAYDPITFVAKQALLDVIREGKKFTVTVTPIVTEQPEKYLDANDQLAGTARLARLGFEFRREWVPISATKAMQIALAIPGQTLEGMGRSATSVKEASENVGGAISIAQVAGAASKDGIGSTLELGGALSVSLGIMNLLPIGPLDGGQMLIAFLELIRGGRKLSFQIQSMAMNIGMVLVAVLVFSVLALDLGRVVGAKKGSDAPSKPAVKSAK